MLSNMFHTNREAVLGRPILTTDCFVYMIGLTAGVTGRQKVLTPLRHMIILLVYIQMSVFAPYSDLYSI
jgi:hypothetical protein